MGRFGKLTRFVDSLDMEDLGEWITEYDSQGRLVGTPYVEYWDVVHRFCTALEDFCEENPEFVAEEGEKPAGADVIAALNSAISREERCPGVLLGYLNNGAIAEWLRELERLDKGA